MKKCIGIVSAILAVIFVSCVSTPDQGSADQRAIMEGVKAWNSRDPEAAATYWNMIRDEKVQKQYLNYIDLYKAGAEVLESTDSIKASNEAKLLAACNKALDKFTALDSALSLPRDICDKGASLSAKRIDGLVASGKTGAAKKMYDSAVKVYGTSDELENAKKEIDVVSIVNARQASLQDLTERLAPQTPSMQRLPPTIPLSRPIRRLKKKSIQPSLLPASEKPRAFP